MTIYDEKKAKKITTSINNAIELFAPNTDDSLKKTLDHYIRVRHAEIQCAVLSPLVKDVMDIMDIYDAKPSKIVVLTTNFTIKEFPLPMNLH